MVGPTNPTAPLCWYLTGATASGKTGVGIALARILDAEIISMDSMAVYCGMDIGTAKPSREQREEVPHHLIDIVDPDGDFSIALYLKQAREASEQIAARGKGVLFVGGTPLYLKALLRGMDEGPPADWAFRAEVIAEVQQVGPAALHARLQQVDPLSAARLPQTDQRRIIRALEYHHLTGRPISHVQLHFDEAGTGSQRVFVLQWPRSVLHQRICDRVESMFSIGLVDEAAGLLERFGDLGRTASQAVGYREVLAHIRNTVPLATTIDLVKTRTRQFAKRQETWFRGISECRFFARQHGDDQDSVAVQIAAIGMAETSQNP